MKSASSIQTLKNFSHNWESIIRRLKLAAQFLFLESWTFQRNNKNSRKFKSFAQWKLQITALKKSSQSLERQIFNLPEFLIFLIRPQPSERNFVWWGVVNSGTNAPNNLDPFPRKFVTATIKRLAIKRARWIDSNFTATCAWIPRTFDSRLNSKYAACCCVRPGKLDSPEPLLTIRWNSSAPYNAMKKDSFLNDKNASCT